MPRSFLSKFKKVFSKGNIFFHGDRGGVGKGEGLVGKGEGLVGGGRRARGKVGVFEYL